LFVQVVFSTIDPVFLSTCLTVLIAQPHLLQNFSTLPPTVTIFGGAPRDVVCLGGLLLVVRLGEPPLHLHAKKSVFMTSPPIIRVLVVGGVVLLDVVE
jgi:hypothetical protein